MRSQVPKKLLAIVEDINTRGYANLTRLTVLKKWFEHPGRLPAFGLWIAKHSADRRGTIKGLARVLMNEASSLLGTTATQENLAQAVEEDAAKLLHGRARDFQNKFQNQQWGPVRIIHCWPLLLVEEGLALYLGLSKSPTAGYKLAADFCQNYDSRYGSNLNGPSRTKVKEIIRFISDHEALEKTNS